MSLLNIVFPSIVYKEHWVSSPFSILNAYLPFLGIEKDLIIIENGIWRNLDNLGKVKFSHHSLFA